MTLVIIGGALIVLAATGLIVWALRDEFFP